MKAFGAVAALFLLCTSACFAQINIQGEDGSTVTIGPGGININGRGTGNRANVKMGPGGIQIDSNDGYKRSRVNLGQGMTVQTSKAGNTKVIRTVTKRGPTTSVKTSTYNTGTRTYVAPVIAGPTAEEQVTIIEMKIYGKNSAGKPLMARVEKLEIDNLGQKGNGPLKSRINVLAKELGVNITGASTTIINSGNSAIEITSPNARAMTSVEVRNLAPSVSPLANGPALTDMVVNENNQIIKGHCDGNSIVLNGNNCQLQLSGKVGIVTINGNHNRIKSDKLGIVVANGNNNSVTWTHTQGAPLVTNNGRDNAIHQQ